MKFKGVTLVEVLVSSLILVIVITGAMMMLSQNNQLAINVEKNFIAENLIRKHFELCANQGSRNSILYILGPYTTKTIGNVVFTDTTGVIPLSLGAPLDSTYSGAYGVMHKITLEFELYTYTVPSTQSGTANLLEAKGIAKWDGGELSISSLLSR